MSAEALAIVLRHSRSKGTARLVLQGIAWHDGDGGSFPSHTTLAIYANVTETNVKKAIDKLVELGEVTVHVNGGGYTNTPAYLRSNRYELQLQCPPTCDRTKHHRVLCAVCGKPVPRERRFAGVHGACEVAPRPTPSPTRDVPRPGIAGEPGSTGIPRPGIAGEPGYDRVPQPGIGSDPLTTSNHFLEPVERKSYSGERARERDAELDELERWAVLCPANLRGGRHAEHVAGQHGRCTLCAAALQPDGTYAPIGGSRPRRTGRDAASEVGAA